MTRLTDAPEEPTRRLGAPVAPGLAMIAVAYGLARYAYGLFVPQFRGSFDLSGAALGAIGASAYAGYCLAIVVALSGSTRAGPRRMTTVTGLLAAGGIATIAAAPSAAVLAAGILIAGISTGLASPPMSEAVALSVTSARQDRANAIINSGTSVGVILSGAAVLLADQWRTAWTVFAVLAVVVLAWNARAMPSASSGRVASPASVTSVRSIRRPLRLGRPPRGAASRRPADASMWRQLVGARTARLFVAAGGVGFASAAYWTFGRELVLGAGDLTSTSSTLFWVAIGVFGLLGGAAGDIALRFGRGPALRGGLALLAAATALLAAAPGFLPSTYLSAALFGTSYITLSGVILVWGVAEYPHRPSVGLGAGFLMIAVGQVIGSPVAGVLADATNLRGVFFAFAGLAALLAMFDLTGTRRRCRAPTPERYAPGNR